MRELETNGVGAETNRSAAGDAALKADKAAVKAGDAVPPPDDAPLPPGAAATAKLADATEAKPGDRPEAKVDGGAGGEAGDDAPADAHQTVEAAVRAQLSKALGGVRGVIEAAVPTAGFTVSYVITDQLKLSLIIAVVAAVVLLVVRVAQKSNPQFVINSLFGIAIAAFFAMRSGKAEDAFLPGILYNSGYAVAMIFSIAVRWPVVGFIIGSVTGDPTAWRNDPGIVKLCSRLTWLLVLPCVVRVVVQYPLYLAGQVGWLGASKIFMGWPLQVAAFAGMAWLLARGRTPISAARTSAPAS